MINEGPWRWAPPAVRTLGVLFGLAWAGFLIWWGGDLLVSTNAGEQKGGFSFLAFGLLILLTCIASTIYNVMKVRAPAKSREQRADPEEPVFDADAALERYLARKAAGKVELPPVGFGMDPPAPVRPVFGRRGA